MMPLGKLQNKIVNKYMKRYSLFKKCKQEQIITFNL